MAWRQTGDKPLPEPLLLSSLTHICGTRGKWVNIATWSWLLRRQSSPWSGDLGVDSTGHWTWLISVTFTECCMTLSMTLSLLCDLDLHVCPSQCGHYVHVWACHVCGSVCGFYWYSGQVCIDYSRFYVSYLSIKSQQRAGMCVLIMSSHGLNIGWLQYTWSIIADNTSSVFSIEFN